jgi:hypothetical protein
MSQSLCRSFGESATPVLTVRWILLIGNPSDPTEAILLEETTQDFGENSKTRYINDSFNLDTIPFENCEFIDTDKVTNID